MPFAILIEGVPVEVVPGAPFTSTQFKITTPQEAAWAMAPVGSMIGHLIAHSAAALNIWDANDRARYGVYSFVAPVPPDGKRLQSYTLAFANGAVAASGVFADPEVPQEVLRVQGRLQLIHEGLLATIETAVSGADDVTKEYWASTPVFRRSNPILTGMWAALGRTTSQLDTTFIAAANIPV